MTDLMQMLELCDECRSCLQVCPTYRLNEDYELSPIARIIVAKKILTGQEFTPEMRERIYTCTKCHLCTSVCPQHIDIPAIVHRARMELVKWNLGPLEGHNKIIEGLQRLGNAANGDPDKRLDWLPEEVTVNDSGTLLYVGCLASYLVKDAAVSSYLLLKKLGIDFMVLQDEGCCGYYLYDAARLDLAKEKFEENAEKFKKLGIKRVITLCPACSYCFQRYYPQLLGNVDFEAMHIAQLLPFLLKGSEIKAGDQPSEVTYFDPCTLGNAMGVRDEPREALKVCGVKVNDLPGNAFCCGGMIRGVYRELALELATSILDQAPVAPIVSACPFCNFCLNWASHKTGKDKKVTYITETVLQALP